MTSEIAYYVLKDLSTLKYCSKSTIDGAIKAYCHKNRLILTESETQEVFDLVSKGFENLCNLYA